MTFPWDAINNIETRLAEFPRDAEGKLDKEKCADEILDFLIFTYLMARDNIDETIEVKAEDMKDIIYEEVAGENFVERAYKWADQGNVYALQVLLETETHRVFCETMQFYADKKGAVTKTWHTMGDDRVRDTHAYLEDMEVPADAMFFTYDGDGAEYPGGFILPQNNVNCRCYLTYNY